MNNFQHADVGVGSVRVSLPRALVTVCLPPHACTAQICIKRLEAGIGSPLFFLKEELMCVIAPTEAGAGSSSQQYTAVS